MSCLAAISSPASASRAGPVPARSALAVGPLVRCAKGVGVGVDRPAATDAAFAQGLDDVVAVTVADEVVDDVHQGNGHIVGLYWSAGWVADFPRGGFLGGVVRLQATGGAVRGPSLERERS
ncbi:MAG: hypothetical protein WKF73_03595 [Nocardioidaceae bacterium]